jgi:integrase/recombinase XerD
MRPNLPTCHRSDDSAKDGERAKHAALLRQYENDLASHAAHRTVETYLSSVRELLSWLGDHGIPLTEARTTDLEAYRAALFTFRQKNGKPYAIPTQHGHLSAAKSFFRFLFRHRHLLHDPAAAIEMPRRDKRLPRVLLTAAEVKRIIEGIRGTTPVDLRDRAFLETLYATGLRVTELTKLSPYDIDLADGVVRVNLGKGRKDRRVPLTEPAAEALQAYLDRGRPALVAQSDVGYLFPAVRGGYFQRALVNIMLRARARRARIRKHVTCHTFRHSIATHLLRGGADIRHIQTLLGHACLSSTQIYTQVEISDLKRVVTRAHPRGK